MPKGEKLLTETLGANEYPDKFIESPKGERPKGTSVDSVEQSNDNRSIIQAWSSV